MRNQIWILGFLVFTACASPLKKRCEKEDWNAYGLHQGEAGVDWHSDSYPGQCSAEGVNPKISAIEAGFKAGLTKFCTVSRFNAAGIQGEAYSPMVCAPSMIDQLKVAYHAGLLKHCSKQGAFLRGKSGAPNLRVCPADVQTSYDQYYSQGRVVFLKKEVLNRKSRLTAIEKELDGIRKDSQKMEKQLARTEYLEKKAHRTALEEIEFLGTPRAYELKTKLEEGQRRSQQRNEEAEKINLELPGIELEMEHAGVNGTEIPSGSLDEL
jgi:hypothetical protein